MGLEKEEIMELLLMILLEGNYQISCDQLLRFPFFRKPHFIFEPLLIFQGAKILIIQH